MGKLILDPVLKARLNGMNEPMELCDESGRTVGHFLPVATFQKMLYAAVESACPLSPAELQARQHETGGRSLAEIWKRLGRT
jgi:hypothetical protein